MSNHSMALVSAPTGLRAMGASLSKKIVSGPMAGFRWQLTSGGKLFRVLRGLYEPEQTQSFVREIKPGDCVFDIGSHVGWYALLSSRLVGDGGKVLAFEANPRNFWYLQRHVENNQLGGNVSAFHLGISDKQGELYFQSGTGTGTGFLAESGEVRVPTKPVDQLVDEHNAVPTHMKIDVEGGEVAVLEGARKTLQVHHPLIFLSTHGSEIKTQCMNYLAELGYTFESMDDRTVEQCADFVCRYK